MVEKANYPTLLVGFGRMGKIHAEHCAKITELRAVLEPNLDEQDPFVKELKDQKVQFVKTLEEVDPKGLMAIILCCYSKDRKIYFEYAIKHRLAIFCEKPVCQSIEEGLELVNLFKKPENSELPFMMAFQWRFDNILKQLPASGSKAVTVHVFCRDPYPPSSEFFNVQGGTVVLFGVHCLDYIKAITRSDVAEISAIAVKKYFTEDYISEDIYVVTLKTYDGNLGVITVGWHNKDGYEQRAEVFDLEMGIIKANDPVGVITNDKTNPIPHFVIRYRQAYHDELEFFFKNLVGKSKQEVDSLEGKYSSLVDGYKALVWATIAEAANAKGKIIKIGKDDLFDLERIKKLIE